MHQDKEKKIHHCPHRALQVAMLVSMDALSTQNSKFKYENMQFKKKMWFIKGLQIV